MNKCFIAIILIFVAFESFASGGRSGFVDISENRMQIISGTSSSSRMFIYGVKMNGSDCTQPSSPVLYFDALLAKEIYSMLLTAKASGKKVEIIASSCISLDGHTYPKVASVYIW